MLCKMHALRTEHEEVMQMFAKNRPKRCREGGICSMGLTSPFLKYANLRIQLKLKLKWWPGDGPTSNLEAFWRPGFFILHSTHDEA